ncbi:hypothetical protein Tco_0596547 [Tanacetum coccineum]
MLEDVASYDLWIWHEMRNMDYIKGDKKVHERILNEFSVSFKDVKELYNNRNEIYNVLGLRDAKYNDGKPKKYAIKKHTIKRAYNGCGKVVIGASLSSRSSQPGPRYCSWEEVVRLRKEAEENRKAFQSQALKFQNFVNFYNRQQTSTSSRYLDSNIYTLQVFLGPSYTPPDFSGYRSTFDPGSSS